MTAYTYVSVSYYCVGVSYPWVGYGGEGYPVVIYPWVGYVDVGVSCGVVGYSPVTYTVVAVAVTVAVTVTYRRVGYVDVGEAARFLPVGNLRCRMVPGNVTENTLSGLDTGPRPG